MKIKQKLILGFAGIASFVGIMGYLSTYTAQKILLKNIGENTMILAIETMDKINKEIYHITEDFQVYSRDSTLQKMVSESNREFDKLEDVQNYIDKIDSEWASIQITNLLHEITNNEISRELMEKIEFHEHNLHYKAIGEVLVTNKYGATIASTGKTSDYKQSDEQWWQKAKENGLYVHEAEFDDSACMYATVIAIKIEDKGGNFTGVLKVVSDITKTINTIKKTAASQKYHIAQIKLLTKDGRIIYDTDDEFKQFDFITNEKFFSQMKDDSGYFLKKSEEYELDRGEDELMAYAKSQDRNNMGLGWIIAIEYHTEELFAPVKNLRNMIAGASLILTISAIAIGLLISTSISQSIKELVQGASIIGKGNLTHKVNIKNKDELGELAGAFNTMTENLRKATVSHDILKLEITERKKAEEALQENSERLKAIFDTVQAGIFLIHSNDHVIIDTNQVAAEMIGIPKEQIIGRKCHKFVCPEENGNCPVSDMNQDMNNSERILLTANGKEIPILKTVTPVRFNGKDYLLESFIDITERKRTEKELQNLNDKLLQSNQQLQEFTYVASHDLREPIRKISSFGEMLAESIADKLSDDDKENLNYMINGAERMQQMIEALLAYSRVTTKGVASERVDLNETIEQLKTLELSVKLEETGGSISVPEPLPQVFVDPVQIRQLLQNLIANALKYHKKDTAPQITIRAKTRNHSMVKVEMQDNGIGIKKEQLKNAFIMFRRLNPSSEYEGTGIGLAVCKRIVERHGGQIGIESTFGEGSTFWFTIPAAGRAVTQKTEQFTTTTAG